MKTLWFCNCPLRDRDLGTTGTWLDAMGRGLAASADVDLGIIAPALVDSVTRQDCAGVSQWLVPIKWKPGRDGLPRRSHTRRLVEICQEFSPDLVHVWGTETYWGLLTARGIVPNASLLTVQGVKYRIAPHLHGALSFRERFEAVGPKDIARMLLGRRVKSLFSAWEPMEREIMAGHQFVCVQTPWQAAQALSCRPSATVEQLDLPLRQAFAKATPWNAPSDRPSIFSSAAYISPAKGIHTAIRAVAMLRRKYPDIVLRIAGDKPRGGWMADGYMQWIQREISRLGLDDAAHWLGTLSAGQIAAELASCSLMLVPTFAESYCMAFAEAQAVGTPTVVSYTGGTAYLGSDEENCLFFPPGDEAMCAFQMDRVLSERELAITLSRNARELALVRNDSTAIIRGQLRIYRSVLDASNAPRIDAVAH